MIQPTTRCDEASTRRATATAPSSATATSRERGVTCSRSRGGGAAINRYSTGGMTAPDEPRPPRLVREVDLDWRSVLVALAALVGLLTVRGLTRRVPRTITAL